MKRRQDFDGWADGYDQHVAQSLGQFPFDGYDTVLSTVRSMVEPARGLKVLDVGIGTGQLSHALSAQGCKIYGVDFSDQMLEKARQKMPDGMFVLADVAQDYLGALSAEKFDRIISSYFFHHISFDQKIDFIKKSLTNNLLKNGKIIIADIGFLTHKDYDAGRIYFEQYWDDSEDYLCGEQITHALSKACIKSQYAQISSCAGIFTCFAESR